MELRSCATAEVRTSSSMSKGPDLSAFPIPRKGGAKPIAMNEPAEVTAANEQREGETTGSSQSLHTLRATSVPERPPLVGESNPAMTLRAAPPKEVHPHTPSGQTVATTVKLDENRYLRLADAGKPGPGRLKRRTIQEMVIEALDEWFERRGI
jgi:hypothetical protein